MTKYKLIKEYPGSPGLGTVVSVPGKTYTYANQNPFFIIDCKDVLDYPEFWEEVIEKEYQVLTYQRKGTEFTRQLHYDLKEDGFYHTREGDYTSYFKESDFDETNPIISVRKLSNGEVFTVGDKITIYGENKAVIESFTINELWLGDFIVNTSEYNSVAIGIVSKQRLPLFKTEDGVDIFKGEKVFFIELDDNEYSWKLNTRYVSKRDTRFSIDETLKSFSTKEAAEEYILMNKPCLSIKDVIKVFNVTENGTYSEDLKKLIKERI